MNASRRDVLRLTATALAWAAIPRLGRSAEPRLLRIGHILSAAAPESATRGALLAAEEASRAAELLGARFELRVGEASELIEEGALALVSCVEAPGRAALGELAAARGIALITTHAPGDLAEDEPLRSHVFHVSSSPRDRREVLARWTSGGAEIADWHPSLERFGAEQLNQRYRQRFGNPMDSLAWASWTAVKIAAEAALRNAIDRIAKSGFDGHKGVRLRFRAKDHVLHQPLYVVAGDRVLAELSPEEEEG